MATYGVKSANITQSGEPVTKRSTMEYRMAFKDYIQKGVKSDILEFRENQVSGISNLGVLLPETVLNELISETTEKRYGSLFAKVRKSNIIGGVKIGISNFTATFHRIAEDGIPVDTQTGGGITGSITFGYLLGSVTLATSYLQSIMQVDIFERELVKCLMEAAAKEFDKEILSGRGAETYGEFEGICWEAAKQDSRIPAANIIEMTAADFCDWTKWNSKVFSKIPLSMRGLNSEWVFSVPTFEYLRTMHDNNNRPLTEFFFDNQTGEEATRFRGKPVNLIESDLGLADFDTASNGDFVGMLWIPSDCYMVNSNKEWSIDVYQDQTTLQKIYRGICCNDGKCLQADKIFLIKKKV